MTDLPPHSAESGLQQDGSFAPGRSLGQPEEWHGTWKVPISGPMQLPVANAHYPVGTLNPLYGCLVVLDGAAAGAGTAGGPGGGGPGGGSGGNNPGNGGDDNPGGGGGNNGAGPSGKTVTFNLPYGSSSSSGGSPTGPNPVVDDASKMQRLVRDIVSQSMVNAKAGITIPEVRREARAAQLQYW